MKDLHLLLLTLVITGIGIVVLIIRSGLQLRPNSLREVPDDEEREGETVSYLQYTY